MIIRLIVLLIIGAIMFMAMRAPLRAAESALRKALTPHNNYLRAAISALPAYTPAAAAPTPTATTVVATTTTPTVVSPEEEYLAYKTVIRNTLRARWNAVPSSAIDAAMADPQDVLAPGASELDWWTSRVTAAAAADVAASTGLPPAIASALLTADDIENVYTMICAVAAATSAATTWNSSCQDMPVSSFVAAHKALTRRARPITLIPAYVAAAATTLGIPLSAASTGAPAINSLLTSAAAVDSLWMPLRLRAGDC